MQGVKEFTNELVLICELQHKNLVGLLGCYIHGAEKFLIYEYMENKSLDFNLFDCTRRKSLDWMEGISDGLAYLHSFSKVKIIHRDMKAANLLLDENMTAKILDFGTTRTFAQHESKVETKGVVGTIGCIAPEYFCGGICSTKCDVYSFGVLLVEIVSGRSSNCIISEAKPHLTLVGHVCEVSLSEFLWKKVDILHLMDESLNDSFNPNEVQRCIHIALLCVEEDASYRPTMEVVISMLRNKDVPHVLPRKPVVFGVEREISKKQQMLKHFRHFCLTVFDSCQWYERTPCQNLS